LFFQLVERRCGREPLQYVVGTQEFWGEEIRVTPAVLIPRPETEGLVEQVLSHHRGNSTRIVDVGCGSGCIAIALAKDLPDAEVYATETSPPALAVARDNAQRLGIGERIMFYQGDLLQPLFDKGLQDNFDVVVSNPPYVSDEEIESLTPEIREYEPRVALAAGKDGLDVIRRLLPEAEAILTTGGRLFLEIGEGMEPQLKELLSNTGLTWEKTVPDLQGIPRVVVARK
jgi:release factor glutamine methyltransferase